MSSAPVAKPPPSPTIYIDTMVFIYKLQSTTHYLFPKANAFFADIQNKKFIGTISTFTFAEFQSVVKRLLSEARGKAVAQSDVSKAIATLNDFVSQMGIRVHDADLIVDKKPFTMFYRVEKLIEFAKPIQAKNLLWHVIGGADAINITLAEASGADMFATFDQGFKGTSGTTLKMLILSEVY